MPDATQPVLDVLVIGEVLVEISTRDTILERTAASVDFSGDALNVACAAAAAGARTALLARIPDDDLGDAIVAKLRRFGVRTDTVIRGPGQHGLYLSHGDPRGEREFTYVRRSSFGSTLNPDDLDPQLARSAAVVTASGVATAVSATAAALVERAAAAARCFVYDPNLRLRLTTAEQAGATLRRLLPLCAVVTPSWPTETRALLRLPDDAPEAAAIQRLRRLGARDIVLTRGAHGSLVAAGAELTDVPVVPAPSVIDQTGAGDSMTGTLCARLAAGDSLVDAVRLGAAAASLSVGGLGGTGRVPTLNQIHAHRAGHPAPHRPATAGLTRQGAS
jgi:2-dehydro-3-deoxygluconokinase